MSPLVSSNFSFGDQDLSALETTINLIMFKNNLKGLIHGMYIFVNSILYLINEVYNEFGFLYAALESYDTFDLFYIICLNCQP